MRTIVGLGLVLLIGCSTSQPAERPPAPGPVTTTLQAPADASTEVPTDASGPRIVGVWRGTSLCTVQPSACHDERVVYRFAAGATPDLFTLDADKIVDGKALPMGTLSCELERALGRLSCRIPTGVFVFVLDGDGAHLHGTLDLTDGTRFRIVEVTREPD